MSSHKSRFFEELIARAAPRLEECMADPHSNARRRVPLPHYLRIPEPWPRPLPGQTEGENGAPGPGTGDQMGCK